MTTKAEQETIIRWDQEELEAHLYTAYPAQARRWTRLGYPVQITDRDSRGRPRGWNARVPIEAIRFRKVQDGAVVKRRGHRKGHTFGVRRDQVVEVEG